MTSDQFADLISNDIRSFWIPFLLSDATPPLLNSTGGRAIMQGPLPNPQPSLTKLESGPAGVELGQGFLPRSFPRGSPAQTPPPPSCASRPPAPPADISRRALPSFQQDAPGDRPGQGCAARSEKMKKANRARGWSIQRRRRPPRVQPEALRLSLMEPPAGDGVSERQAHPRSFIPCGGGRRS